MSRVRHFDLPGPPPDINRCLPDSLERHEGFPQPPARPVHALVVSPHPDDAEFGAAGTVARWAKEGYDSVYAICTDGDKGTADINIRPEDLARTREREQVKAASLLGVKAVVFLGYPDQELEDTPEFRKALVRLIRIYRPRIVVTADPYRRYVWHRDHRITGMVVLDAVFPYARDHLAFPDLFQQGLEPHRVKELLFWASEDPDYCSDVSDTFSLKLAALHCHESQIANADASLKQAGAGIEEWLVERHRQVGEGAGFQLGEAFHRAEILW